MILIIDLSTAMMEKDLRPDRYRLTIGYTKNFISEFFEQNPISQLAIIGMRDGIAVRISDMSGNPNDHTINVEKLSKQEGTGQPSLQNALDMARAALFHAPMHTTREVLIIFGSLISSDPGDIHATITALMKSHVSCTVIGLAAQVAICRTLTEKTNPSLPSSQTYNVALDEQHFRELLMRATTPPTASRSTEDSSLKSSLLMMGFPSRIVDPAPTLCACHSQATRGGYLCSRCYSKVCSLPTSCPACGLTLILSTHLARSYHHLFPLRNWREVSWSRAASSSQQFCFGCQTRFAENPLATHRRQVSIIGGQNRSRLHAANSVVQSGVSSSGGIVTEPLSVQDGVSESGRYECETCGSFFCIDCDVCAHEVVHNCPGCQSREGILLEQQRQREEIHTAVANDG